MAMDSKSVTGKRGKMSGKKKKPSLRTRFIRARRRFRKRMKKRREEYNRFNNLRTFQRSEKKNLSSRLGFDRWYKDEILTLTRRNKYFIDKYNPKPLLKNTTKTSIKDKLESTGIPVPETYLVISSQSDMDICKDFLEHGAPDSFAIKPDNSFGGAGILIIKQRVRDYFLTEGDKEMSVEQVLRHVKRVQAGSFSRGKQDKVLIEQRVVSTDLMADIVHMGLPDIRVIVLAGFPVMAMTRIPTKASKWKANLHSGAVGAGISLSTGKIIHAIYKDNSIEYHPDSNKMLMGFQIPYWRDVLEIASNAQMASDLGYVGVDVVIDDNSGPLVLEVNKRAGLDIQKANSDGLLKRLRWIEREMRKEDPDHKCPFLDTNPKHRVHQAIIWDQNKWKSGRHYKS